MTRIGTNLFLWALVFAHLPTALASTRYVNGVSGSDTNNCASPATACKTIGHAIAQSAAGDAIMVAAATYTENLTLAISLEIIGAGSANTVIDGGGAASVIDISVATAHVTLSGVTLTHGAARDGGGIFNVGSLTLVNSSVTGNGAIQMGGGIYNNGGTATINNSTVSSNGAGTAQRFAYAYGGGIANSGMMTINNSTISGNTAVHWNNSYSYAYGGGIWNRGTMNISNSTISGNSAEYFYYYLSEGGGILNAGTLTISSSTIAGNRAPSGGGIYGSAALHNVVIANNTGGNCRGTISSQGYNLSSDASCNFRGPGDLNSTDPTLGTLGSYGGLTQTIPLLSGSPAIDSGDPNGCTDSQGHLLTTDQRGYPRPDKEDKGGCDRGSYESQSD